METRRQWAGYLVKELSHFRNRTNNRLESLNAKIKGVVTKYATMPKFFSQLMICFSSLNIEKDHRKIVSREKVSTAVAQCDHFEERYKTYLTSFAFQKLKVEIEKLNDVIFDEIFGDFGVINVNNRLNVTKLDTCWCEFFTTMRLPCKHILALRNQLNVNIYDETICGNRWAEHFQQPSFSKERYLPQAYENQPNQNQPMTQLQKYAKAKPIVNNIAEYIAEKSQQNFNRYFQNLTNIRNYIHDNIQFNVVPVNQPNAAEEIIPAVNLPENENRPDADENGAAAVLFPVNDQHAAEEIIPAVILPENENRHDIDENIPAAVNEKRGQKRRMTPAENPPPTLPPKQKKRGRPKGFGKTIEVKSRQIHPRNCKK